MAGSATLTTVASRPATNDPEDRGQQRQALAAVGHALMLRRGVPLSLDSKRRGPEPPGVLSAASAPEGASTTSERRASQPLGLALCGSVPRRGAT